MAETRKAVDPRIQALIRNGIQDKKRSFFVVVGDRSKDVIVYLHHIMSRENLKQNKSVLWAYKKNLLGFTSHRKKRENKIKKEIKRGIREANSEDPFELFVSLHNIRYVYYKETEKILGNTYGMCILQDFQALTPNILARTIETVEGGGLVILLLSGMNTLKQLYTMSMDAHSRYRTEAHQDVVARFNERFLLSLGGNESCLVIDDEMNVLPISGGKGVKPLPPPNPDQPKTSAQQELESMKESHQDSKPAASLITLSKTVDQAKAFLTFLDAISEKTLRSTVALTAARGRGKSALLGLAVAASISYGYSNIFVTSPSPENLKTFFEFVFKGFDALGFQDHADYSIIQSTNPDWNKCIVRVNVHRAHRQVIQYIRPQDHQQLSNAEIVVIDEAAAIPLPVVKQLMKPCLVFMSSTISGYEGTGRSLSLKLLKNLREQSRTGIMSDGVEVDSKGSQISDSSSAGRSLREITLSEPVRYARGDAVERWLNTLLCLDATLPRSKINTHGCPDPNQCQLLNVNRDTLFSFHPVSEKFLQSMVALFVSSHYKNTPDDLQLMSDAPSHELFVLTPPITEPGRLPDPLVVIQIALEGQISRQGVLKALDRGTRPSGDLIAWCMREQFQDDNFPGLSGARVVRIATHPDFSGMGYGSKALELLVDYYESKFTNLSEDDDVTMEEDSMVRVTDAELANGRLDDDIKVRDIAKMPPLFAKLSERRPAALDWIGVSYGLTQPLHKFWKRASFSPVYLRQTTNDLTGEHTMIMLRALERSEDRSWLGAFSHDFHGRFMTLLSFDFRDFPCATALSIDESANIGASLDPSVAPVPLSKSDLDMRFTPFDIKRLESYSRNLLDYRVILDLTPKLAELYFNGRLKSDVKLSAVQQSILLAIGLQHKPIEVIAQDLKSVTVSQVLAMFIKIISKVVAHFNKLISGAIEADMPTVDAIGVSIENASGIHDDEKVDTRFKPLEMSLEDELEEGGDEALKAIRAKQRELIDSLPLDQYEIEEDAPGWDDAEKQLRNATKHGQSSTVVSVKSSKSKRKEGPTAADVYDEAFGEKKHKKAKKSKKSHS